MRQVTGLNGVDVKAIFSVLVRHFWLLGLACGLSGCETGHLWSLYSLGFTERDAYIDNLGDARDSLGRVVEELEHLASSAQATDTRKSNQLRDLTAQIKTFRRQLSTSQNAAGDWLRHWQSRPDKYHSNGYTAEQVQTQLASIDASAKTLVTDFKDLARLAKTGFLPTTAQWREDAQQWLATVNEHLFWLESDDSGYPKNKPLIF